MSMSMEEAKVEAFGIVGPAEGDPASHRSLEAVQEALELSGGDVVRAVDALGGNSASLPSLDDWRAFRESCGLNLSDAAMRCLCRAAVE